MSYRGIDWKSEIDNAVAMGKRGLSLVQIGNHYGVSRQRIKQVFQQYGIDPEEVGLKIKTRRSREETARRHWSKWGDKEQQLYAEKRHKFRVKKSNAKRSGIPFELDFATINWPTHCPVLGMELNYLAEGKQENSVSFDRIDPSIGYTNDNTIIVSVRANRIKNDGSIDDLQKIAKFYSQYLVCKSDQ